MLNRPLPSSQSVRFASNAAYNISCSSLPLVVCLAGVTVRAVSTQQCLGVRAKSALLHGDDGGGRVGLYI